MKITYRPYVGGAGPTPAQTKNNDAYLMQELKKSKISFRIGCMTEIAKTDPYPLIFIKLKKGELDICYDRWGYTGLCRAANLQFDNELNVAKIIESIKKKL